MEFQDVIRRRRMVRRYDTDRPVPPDVVDRILQNGLRAPSAGFSQGWAFLILDDPADVARFRDAVRPPEDPDGYFAARVEAPLVIGPVLGYRHRVRRPPDAADCGGRRTRRVLFGLPAERVGAFRAEFGVPP